jgi:hypothetical protein
MWYQLQQVRKIDQRANYKLWDFNMLLLVTVQHINAKGFLHFYCTATIVKGNKIIIIYKIV